MHEEGWTVELLAGGEASFRRPDGRLVPQVPTLPVVPENVLAALAAQLAEHGVTVDPAASVPFWAGERLDLDYALDTLRRL